MSPKTNLPPNIQRLIDSGKIEEADLDKFFESRPSKYPAINKQMDIMKRKAPRPRPHEVRTDPNGGKWGISRKSRFKPNFKQFKLREVKKD